MSGKRKIQKVKMQVQATSMGYYKNKIVREGEKFLYEGNIIGGKLPLWVKGLEKIKEVEETKEVSDIV